MIRNNSGRINGEHRFIRSLIIINARRTNDLGNDDTFRTIDDKCAGGSHQGEITHKDFLLLDFLSLFVSESNTNLERCSIRRITCFALLNAVFRPFVHLIVDEAQFQVTGEVRNGVYISKHFPKAGFQKPLVRSLLDLEKIRHVLDFFTAGKTLTQSLTIKNIFRH